MARLCFALFVLLTACSGSPDSDATLDEASSNQAAASPYRPNALDNQMTEMAQEGEASTNANARVKMVAGDECLSLWDGSAMEFVDKVKATLRDPDSFEHIETNVGPITSTGKRPITMKYRARNGFGGMEVEELPAVLDPHDCKVTLLTSGRQTKRLLGG